MPYKHGIYGEFGKSVSITPKKTTTNIVYVGTAPVHLVRGWKTKGLVNNPVSVNGGVMRSAVGYSEDWEAFTLCSPVYLHFENTIQAIGPITVINVLDPDKHQKAEKTTVKLQFINNYARIQSDRIILDTLVLDSAVEGTDFTVDYDFATSTAEIYKVNEDLADEVTATYSEVDPSAVTEQDVVGGITPEGVRTGLGCLGLVYQELGLITNILAAPGWSHNKAVYAEMIKVSQKINGHWYCMVVADIPIADTDTIEKAIKWRSSNDYTSEFTKVCWPMWKTTDDRVYYISTLTAWLSAIVDNTHGGIPMESPSNKVIPTGKQYFGEESQNRGYDQSESNQLNEKGITTAVYWGGNNVLWGPHTAAYEYGKVTDRRAIFDNSIRMMMHILNDFQQEHATEIDSPMTKSKAETIRVREQEKADALASLGALIGNPEVVFEETDNPTSELVEGNFYWRTKGTPTPPFKSGTMQVSYTDEGFETYFGGEE